MNAAAFIGRLGPLAVTLGIGSAIAIGIAGPAAADPRSPDPSSSAAQTSATGQPTAVAGANALDGDHPRFRIVSLTEQLVSGADLNSDGRVTWELGEGGLQQVQEHVNLMLATEMKTAGAAAKLKLEPDREEIRADSLDAANGLLRTAFAP